MSVKDVKNYYDEVSQQYQDMLPEIHDFEELAMNNMFEPERLDAIMQTIQPLMRNYEMISYVMFLLNKPNKKKKHKKYENMMRSKVNSIPKECTKDGVKETNSGVIRELNEQKNKLKNSL